ncbi:unnamed protein product [Auanema sp. JU1783]|nr:unnamed protein product [Auanema sp. JU1783]
MTVANWSEDASCQSPTSQNNIETNTRQCFLSRVRIWKKENLREIRFQPKNSCATSRNMSPALTQIFFSPVE